MHLVKAVDHYVCGGEGKVKNDWQREGVNSLVRVVLGVIRIFVTFADCAVHFFFCGVYLGCTVTQC